MTVKRSDDNGGDITFSSTEEIVSSFGDNSLHPGDLKNAVSSIIVEVLDKVASGLKSDAQASKAAKGLKALQKRKGKKEKSPLPSPPSPLT